MIENVTTINEKTSDAYINMQFKKNPALILSRIVFLVACSIMLVGSIIGLIACIMGNLARVEFLFFLFLLCIGFIFFIKGIRYKKIVKNTVISKGDLGRENYYKFSDENILVLSSGMESKIEWKIINLWFVYNNCLYFMAGSNKKMYIVMEDGFTNGSLKELLNIFKNKVGNPLPDNMKLDNEIIRKSVKRAKAFLFIFCVIIIFAVIMLVKVF